VVEVDVPPEPVRADERAGLGRVGRNASRSTTDERRRLREAAGASLRDVARALDTSPTSVIRWERGASPGDRTAASARLLEEFRQLAT
jgi:DNA-binding transcriptional regulator YiaG